jgi:4-amino-4-deoxy-L-arabinose transferase-like glycosyltransferase
MRLQFRGTVSAAFWQTARPRERWRRDGIVAASGLCTSTPLPLAAPVDTVDAATVRRKTAVVMSPRPRTLRIAICALVAALLYLPGLGRPALWEPDEGRYAEIAREMVVSGDYVTPHDNFVRYFEKPPLVYWAEAGMIRLFGANEFAVRIPAALFTAGEVAITAAIGEAMFGAEVGLLAALALALSPLVFGFARFATLDPALAFFMTAAIGAFYAAAHAPDFDSGAGRLWMLAAAAALGLGTLCKGPVALLLGGAIALAWLLMERRGGEIRRIPFLSCIAIYAAIAAPWFAIANARNPGFLHFFFVHENFQRFVESSEHGWGPYFFIPIVLGGAWPWIWFAPLGWSEIARAPEADRAGAISARRLLLAWFAIVFVFFSIPRSKLGSYILPAMPPVAILAGYGVESLRAVGAERRGRILRDLAIVTALAALAAALALAGFEARIGPRLALDGILICAALVLGTGTAWMLGRGEPPRSAAVGALALAMIAVLVFAERARSDVAARRTYRNLAHAVMPYLDRGCALVSYRHFVQALPFYTGHRELLAEYWGELAEFPRSREERSGFIGNAGKLGAMWSSPRCVVLIANRKDIPELMKSLVPAPRSVGCEGKKFALINRPDQGIVPPPACER